MKLKMLALAAALSLASTPALATNLVVDLSSGTASFIGQSIILDGGDDEITFINLAAGTYDFLLSLSSQNILGLTATLNGQPATITELGLFSFASLDSQGDSPFTLVLTGTAGARALYSGELAVTQIPEPGTLALLAAGIGGIAGMGSSLRRKAQA
jgi:hypothetical protein